LGGHTVRGGTSEEGKQGEPAERPGWGGKDPNRENVLHLPEKNTWKNGKRGRGDEEREVGERGDSSPLGGKGARGLGKRLTCQKKHATLSDQPCDGDKIARRWEPVNGAENAVQLCKEKKARNAQEHRILS